MPRFSRRSLAALASAHPMLQEVFRAVIKRQDCTIIQGVRSVEEQQENVNSGRSKTMASKHLEQRDGYAWAVDVAPYPIEWANVYRLLQALPRELRPEFFALLRFYHFAGRVFGTAESTGVQLRWGGDWDSDHEFDDQSFYDLVHFELRSDSRELS